MDNPASANQTPQSIKTAVILAAGQGKRLHPHTLRRSKAMLPILDRPMVRWVMDDLAACGANDFILVANPVDQDIQSYFPNDHLPYRVRLVYQAEPLGMAHALVQAAPLIEGDFFLSACDNLVPAEHLRQLQSRWQMEPRFTALLSLLPAEAERLESTALVETSGEAVRRIVEKPSPGEIISTLCSLPLYVFTPRILELLPRVRLSPRGEYELQDAIQKLIDSGERVGGLEARSRLTVTDASDLLSINLLALDRLGSDHITAPLGLPNSSRLVPPVYIEEGVEIGCGCQIGPRAVIERGVSVGADAIVEESLLLSGAAVPPGKHIKAAVLS